MLKTLPHALDRQGFLREIFVSNFMASAGYLFFVSPRGIDLSDPPRIPIAGRPDQNVLREIPEKKIPYSALRKFRHEIILS